MSDLTPEQQERFVCCMKRHLCKDEHYHERAVVQMLAEERERIAREIEAEQATSEATRDAMQLDSTRMAFDQQAFAFGFAARIARGQA